MITFLAGICILILGYLFWSKVAEKIFGRMRNFRLMKRRSGMIKECGVFSRQDKIITHK